MRIIVLSDTHGKHNKLIMPDGDLLIHCGDITLKGTKNETIDFLNWFVEQNYCHKILIAGNHDYYLEENPGFITKTYPNEFFYLFDSGIEIEGIRFWGSPYTPEYKNMAFNLQRGEELQKHWQKIPENVDILITHGPPKGILDNTVNGENAGCEALLNKVYEIKPQFHLFGHVHEAVGNFSNAYTRFVNASLTNKAKGLQNMKPYTFEI
ncbi:metallophosphatase domain-containing protein [Draconibacterium sp. IB214405]|uniref:metallophosphatase domain-containing protein n=1 Tax=Draconibacterium sp. IB214405 TaxID=3097352 RepID=UPI002A12199D|nr:metallophosphatase domain-containing protein [Draconibacterium sp. IB214405]MDX8341744.1 metallophosphatase domain-containing protein [Draconibacterium sp. IB214405]